MGSKLSLYANNYSRNAKKNLYTLSSTFCNSVDEIFSVLVRVFTLILHWGSITPIWTFYHVATKQLIIVRKAFVTFPKYVCAKNAEKNSDISTSISNMTPGNGHTTRK